MQNFLSLLKSTLLTHLIFIYFLSLTGFCSEKLIESPGTHSDLKRLPRTVIPVFYDLHLLINLTSPTAARKLYSDGSVNITLQVNNDTDFFFLKADLGLKILSYKFTTQHSPAILEVVRLDDESTIRFDLDSQLKRGSIHNMSVVFLPSTRRSKSYQGLYALNSPSIPSNGKLIANTHNEPIYARHVFPCFDEPGFKSHFKIAVTHQSSYNAYSNMPVESKKIVDSNWTLTEFQSTPLMSTYLVTVAVFDMNELETNFTSIDGRIVPVRFYVEKWMIPNAQLALEATVQIFQLMESWFLIPYPLPKIDIFASNIPAYAMENWGIISLKYHLFYPLAFDYIHTVEILAHEVAHQWFGNLVTPEWWTELWLKEGFASYLSILAAKQILPDKSLTSMHLMDTLGTSKRSIMDSDSLSSSLPASREIHQDSDIVATFDKISYGKSCLLISMIHQTMIVSAQSSNSTQVFNHSDPFGHDPLIKGFRSYLKKFSYSTATSRDLWTSFTVGNLFPCEPLETIMEEWTKEWGYPVVNFDVDYQTGVVTITQKRFVNDYSRTEKILFTFQLLIRTSKGHVVTVWVTKEKQTLLLNPEDIGDWVMVESGSRSYYRVNYDFRTWRELIHAISHNSSLFSGAQKSEFLDDAWAIAFTGALPLEVPLIMTPAVAVNETDSVFWNTALGILLDKVKLYGHGSPVEPYFYEYCEKVLQHFPNDTRRQIVQPNRDTVLLMFERMLGEIKNGTYLKILETRFRSYVDNEFSEPDILRKLTLCYFPKYYGIGKVDFKKFMSPEYMDTFALAISYYTNDYQQFMEIFNFSNSTFAVSSLIWHPNRFADCGHYVGSEFIWNHVMLNWDYIWEELSDERARSFLVELHFKSAVTEEKLAQIESFEKQKMHTLGAVKQKFLEVKQKVIRKVRWSEPRYTDRIRKWLEKAFKHPNYLI